MSTSDKLSLFLYLMNPRFFIHEHLKEPVIFGDSRANIADFSMINNINLIVQTIICYFIALVFFLSSQKRFFEKHIFIDLVWNFIFDEYPG
jgi:hypothetical protein